MGEDLRDLISQNIESVEAGTTGAPAGLETPAATPSVPTGTPPAGYQAPAPAAPSPAPATQGATPAPAAGTIPTKEGFTPAPKPPVADPNAPQQNISSVVAAKAPGTWTPEAREHWNNLPEGVRNEVIKREREVSRAMTQSTTARRFQQEFDQAIAPFMGFIAAERSNPIAATVNMMQTSALLRTGTARQKAELAAQVIQQYGIDLQMLDALLAGQQPENNPAAHIEQIVNQRIAPIMQMVQGHQQNQQQQTEVLNQEVDTELSDFAGAHEFYDDVRETMADLIEVASRRGMNMSLTDAYDRATLLHEPVRKVIEQRKSLQSAQRGHQVAQQARSGAVSVKPSDEAGVTKPVAGDSIRDAINFAFETQAGR